MTGRAVVSRSYYCDEERKRWVVLVLYDDGTGSMLRLKIKDDSAAIDYEELIGEDYASHAEEICASDSAFSPCEALSIINAIKDTHRTLTGNINTLLGEVVV